MKFGGKMIYTLTLNPAIDLFIETEHLKKILLIGLKAMMFKQMERELTSR